MTNPKRPETVEEMSAQQMRRRMKTIAERLRRLAGDIDVTAEREARSSYAQLAADVQKEIAWAVANLNAQDLTTDAFMADQACQRRIAAEAIAEQIDAKAERMRTGDGATPTGFAMGAVVAEGAIIAREYAAKEG